MEKLRHAVCDLKRLQFIFKKTQNKEFKAFLKTEFLKNKQI